MQNPHNIMQTLLKQSGWKIGVVVLMMAIGLFFLLRRGPVQNSGITFVVKRGSLPINVLEGGSVEALESQQIRSQIKGYQGTKILSIVEEGYLVTEDDIAHGKILVELDSSELKQRITTQDIQFQSTLSTFIEATKAYEIQINQNRSDLKAAEQKARFALMDVEKFMGKTNTQEIIAKLGLRVEEFVDEEGAEFELPQLTSASPTSPFSMSGAFGGPGGMNPMRMTMMTAPGDRSVEGPRPSGASVRMEGGESRPATRERPARTMTAAPGDPALDAAAQSADPNTGPGRHVSRRGTEGAAAADPASRGPGNMPAGRRPRPASMTGADGTELPAAPGNFPTRGPGQGRPASGPGAFMNAMTPGQLLSATNMPGSVPKSGSVTNTVRYAGTGTNVETTFAPDIDFSVYADVDKLGDGAAKQQLRKLIDDYMLAQTTTTNATIRFNGTKKLYDRSFVTKDTLESERLTVQRNKVQEQSAQTAKELYEKYEFGRQVEDYISKYDEALRSLERARKEAQSKRAQASARKKSAEGRYRIEMEQRQELADQMANCVIRAQRPGLVVYGGGSDDRRFMGGEEQIREGATVRERQSILTIPDMTMMAVKVKIHESHIKKVKKGQKARITIDAFPEETLTGEVIKVGVLPDSGNRWMNPDMKVYITTIAIDGVREWLKPGMTAKVEVMVKELPDVIYVPIQAVNTIGAKQYCYLPNGGKPEQREVVVGDYNDEFIEVKSGLKEGEKVLLRAPDSGQSEGDEAEVSEEDAAGKGTGNSGVSAPVAQPVAGAPGGPSRGGNRGGRPSQP